MSKGYAFNNKLTLLYYSLLTTIVLIFVFGSKLIIGTIICGFLLIPQLVLISLEQKKTMSKSEYTKKGLELIIGSVAVLIIIVATLTIY